MGSPDPGRRPHLLDLAAVIPSPGQPALAKGAGGREALTPPGRFGFRPPLDPVKSSSSVASRQRMGLVWPSAMETHCSGAVRAPLAPPTGVMMPLPGREGERRPSARDHGQAERGSRVRDRRRGTRAVAGAPATAPQVREPRRQPVVQPLSCHPEHSWGASPAGHGQGPGHAGVSSIACLTQNPRHTRPQAPAGRGRGPRAGWAPPAPRRPQGGWRSAEREGAQAARPGQRRAHAGVHVTSTWAPLDHCGQIRDCHLQRAKSLWGALLSSVGRKCRPLWGAELAWPPPPHKHSETKDARPERT